VTEGYAGNRLNIALYIETLPNGVSYRVLDEKTHSSLDNTAEYIVPEGHYFTLGDNRDSSSDSRSSVGFVPAGNFVGRAEVIYFSQDVSAKWWQVWSWPQTIRSDRIGDGIE
ncbi:MAG: signal peptidase I, partial [Alphaproteobacteria bacterium]|nr:signal peptidase I [Alphaproteobacteria bacterium]